MKKLALALVASTIAAGAASANHTISTGFYAGAAVGYSVTTGKAKTTIGPVVVTTPSGNFTDNNANIGIYAGYGLVNACTYLGGEVSYTFENTKANAISNLINGNGVPINFNYSVRRNGYFNAALRAGYLFTPSTMVYIRLGGNYGKYKFTTIFTAPTIANFAPVSYTSNKSKFSFVPGFGLETSIYKNVSLRGEYSYEFGPSIRSVDSTGTDTSTANKIRVQSFKVGLSYKF